MPAIVYRPDLPSCKDEWVANEYLRTHLFGDFFERDNLDWQSRELATVGMLSALPGAESQLQAHLRISMNVGITAGQLQALVKVLGERVDVATGERAQAVLARHLASLPPSAPR